MKVIIMKLFETQRNKNGGGGDLNFQPSGYEPDELPNCSTRGIYIAYI